MILQNKKKWFNKKPCLRFSQLQVIKLLKAEPGKKNKINLRFLVGSRVVKNFQKSLEREQALTGLLK